MNRQPPESSGSPESSASPETSSTPAAPSPTAGAATGLPEGWPSRRWVDWTTTDFARLITPDQAERNVAVLPVAAIEQHGPHLPVDVDTAIAQGIVDRCWPHLAAQVPALFLPVQALGKSTEHIRFPGTLHLSTTTAIALWMDIGESVHRAGFRKLVLFNTHGGQVSLMDIVARELRTRLDMLVFSVNWYDLPLAAAMEPFSAEEQRFGIHGGAVETAMMLALDASRVRMEHAQNFPSTSQPRSRLYPILGNGRSVKWGWQTQDYNPQGACGNATTATPEQGHALLEAAAAQLAVLLAEIADLPLSTLVDDHQL